MAKKKDENLDLAKEHIKLAEDLVVAEGKKAKDPNNKKIVDAELSLERAESDLDEISEDDFDEEIE